MINNDTECRCVLNIRSNGQQKRGQNQLLDLTKINKQTGQLHKSL